MCPNQFQSFLVFLEPPTSAFREKAECQWRLSSLSFSSLWARLTVRFTHIFALCPRRGSCVSIREMSMRNMSVVYSSHEWWHLNASVLGQISQRACSRNKSSVCNSSHRELLGFWTFSIVRYSRKQKHDVSETGPVSVLGRRHLLSWAP
jgi:hypothetical protein